MTDTRRDPEGGRSNLPAPTEPQQPQTWPGPEGRPDDDARREGAEVEVGLLDLLLAAARHRRLVLGSVIGTFVLACIATLLMHNVYTAVARILPPPQDKPGLGSFLSGASDLASLAGISLGGASGDLYVSMLQSRTVSDAIIDRFKLMEVYDQPSRTKMYRKLGGLVKVSLGKKDGIITVNVDDEDPGRAAAIANAYVEELKKLNVRLSLSGASRERVFLEGRLALVKGDLAKAEDRLKEFQAKNKAISIDAQSSAVIEGISQLKAALASKEVELGVLLTSQTESSPEVKALRETVAQFKDQLRRMEQSPQGRRVSDDIFIPTSRVPELGVQYLRLLRDSKIQETLFELLTKQYELAKITEAKSVSSIQVLDDAVKPDRKSKPRRSILVLLSTVAAGLLSTLVALLLELGERLNDEDRRRWETVRRSLLPSGRPRP